MSVYVSVHPFIAVKGKDESEEDHDQGIAQENVVYGLVNVAHFKLVTSLIQDQLGFRPSVEYEHIQAARVADM